MGILFCTDYRAEYEKMDKKVCYKCYDKFYTDKTGIYSRRNSCRYHNFKNDVCIDCRGTRSNCKHTCYHIKEKKWYNFLSS